ncbi:MAG TPA: CDP-diacylglycerol--glycerol-3-phosphate 3-phosphatidyltransferase [Anaerolineae bacterium]|nr:CDP-diacylglycerol--glycerol-3-phosphate 3-phosphatidyltransferase [Anaerolineae bacterium]
MNWADWLSISRIVITPLLLFLLWRDQGWTLYAAAVFTLAAMTDGLDGYLARRQRATSHGVWLDLAADKVLVLGTLAMMAALRIIPVSIPLLISGREVLVMGLRLHLQRRGVLLPADRWGKVKMAVLCLAITGLLLAQVTPTPILPRGPAYAVLLAGTTLTLLSGANYGLKTWFMLRSERR